MGTVDKLKEYAELAVDFASDKVEGLLARASLQSQSQIRFSNSSIDINKRWEGLTLEVLMVIQGSQIGMGERSISGKKDVKALVTDTLEFSKQLPESMFFAGVEDSISSYRELQGCYDDKIDTFAEQAPEIVNASIDAALSEGAKRVAGALRFGRDASYFKSSYGPEGSVKSTSFDLNLRAFQDELDYSGQGLECGTIPSSAEEALIAAGAKAGKLSKDAIGAKQGKPGTYDLILSPTVAADVIGYLPGAANPFLVLVGLSPLADKVGAQIGPDFVTASDDPTIEGGLASRRYDFEGTPARKTELIDKGVLKSFVHNTTSGRMYETQTTGNSGLIEMGQGLKMLLPINSNIVFDNGDHTFDELLETNRPTIYVTCNWYTRWQNYQTGDFSTIPRDAMFLLEKGEMKPIKNIRISDNMLRMFKNITALGNDQTQVYWWEVDTPTFISTVKVKDCRITAATQ